MVKLIIEFRDVDSEGDDIDNKSELKEITHFCRRFFNCESIGECDSDE